MFLYNDNHSYDAHFHSSKGSRGVGILISKKLSYKIIKKYSDLDENIVGMILEMGDVKLRVFSIYGPNHDNQTFYRDMDRFMREDPSLPIIIGGDWNTTYSTAPTRDNIDIINMRNPPSLVRAGWLRTLCENHHLSDPFRALHPTMRDFSFSPSGNRRNRSRLDFFLIGDETITRVNKCHISAHLSTKVLDHKPVILDFTRNKTKPRPFINRTILANPMTDDIVLATFMDTYLTYIFENDPDNQVIFDEVHHAVGVNPIQNEREKVGRLLDLIRRQNNGLEALQLNPLDNLLSLQVAAIKAEIRELKETLWSRDTILRLKLNVNPDTFLEVLMGNVKGNVISFQHWVKKLENLKKTQLLSQLHEHRTRNTEVPVTT